MRRCTVCCVVVAVTGVLTLPVEAASDPQSDPFATCRRQLAVNPADYESAFCFFEVTRTQVLWEQGARVFEELTAADPANAWLPLAYGHVYRSRDPARAERLYRQAADAFTASGHAEGEVLARSNLRDFLFPLGRVAEAVRELERVLEIGNASDDPLLKARAWSLQALHIHSSGGDLGVAFRLLKQAEAAVFPHGPYRLKRTTLNSLAMVAASAGRFDEAIVQFHRLDALATEAGEAQTQAVARYNLFNTTAMKEGLLPSPGGRPRLLKLAADALEAGRRAADQMVLVRSHSALAELLANTPGSRTAARAHLRACLALATKARQPYDEAVCSWIEAALLQPEDPRTASAAAARALEATRRANNPRTDAYSAGRHMRFSWSTRLRPEAIRDSLAAIDAIETLRALQDDANSSAALFSAWTLDYYWLAGRLLEDGGDQDLSLAFSIAERMRARALLDSLDRIRPSRDPRHPTVREHRAVLEAIAAVQQTLMNPALDDARRRDGLRNLEALERKEQEAERQMALALPEDRRPSPAFATLDQVQSALGANEALLSFQVGLWNTYEGEYGGGSWLIATTRNSRSAHRLPDRVRLADAVPVFAGLLQGDRGREAAASVRLYDELLAEAIAGLPPTVTRLVIIADGQLHHLPFAALRAAPGAPPLGARYELVNAPSATLWLHWKAAARAAPARRVLTFVDPVLDGGPDTNALTRNATLLGGLQLGRLPYAQAESRAISRYVGAAEALVGPDASEQALKARDLRSYGVVHVAAHAIADEMHPERSGIVLARGSTREDGLLQAREIATLDLEGAIVVLSACYTSGGAVLSGEGVLSLARAFFQAGAHAVVGSRWPLRDAEAARLFDAFYRHLARGVSVSEALKATQDDARAAGRPASGWAALELLGNGDLRPFPKAPSSTGDWSRVSIAGLIVTALAAAAVTLQRSLRQRTRR
jgi:CHAT domain-containing protein